MKSSALAVLRKLDAVMASTKDKVVPLTEVQQEPPKTSASSVSEVQTPSRKKPRRDDRDDIDIIRDITIKLGVIDHPNDILMDLHEPKMVPDANCVLLPEQPRNIHSDKIEIRSSPQTSGVGVFVRKDCSLDPGDIATEYGGAPSWKTPQQVSELIKKKRNPYVFTIGPFELRNTKHRKYLLCWDGGTLGYDCHTTNCGHLLNTSHPRLLAPWDKENCMFALYLNDLKLTYTPPNAKLYVMVTHNIDGGLGSNPLYELRLDYHSVLASEFGFWCLELGCKECVENLIDFVDTFLRPSST